MNQALEAAKDYIAERKIQAEEAKKRGDYFWAYSNVNAELHGLMHQCRGLLECMSQGNTEGDIMFDINKKLLTETVEQYWKEYEAEERNL